MITSVLIWSLALAISDPQHGSDKKPAAAAVEDPHGSKPAEKPAAHGAAEKPVEKPAAHGVTAEKPAEKSTGHGAPAEKAAAAKPADNSDVAERIMKRLDEKFPKTPAKPEARTTPPAPARPAAPARAEGGHGATAVPTAAAMPVPPRRAISAMPLEETAAPHGASRGIALSWRVALSWPVIK